MKKFEPTDFIEQYNTKDEYKMKRGKNEHFSILLPFENLQYWLDYTATFETLHTVAIFKIQFKDAAKK